MKRMIALALLTGTSAAAQAPPPRPGFSTPAPRTAARPCLTPAEAKGLATFILPGLVDGLASRCRASLPRAAFLRQLPATTLAQRLRRDGEASWPVAKAAIEKLNGERLPGLFGQRFLMGMAEGMAADLVLRDLDKTDCGPANDLVEFLAPLPSPSFSSVIASLIALGGDSEDDKSPVRICPAPQVPAASSR